MTFASILFEHAEVRPQVEVREAPDYFVDLNLDQIIDAIVDSRKGYDLKPFFYQPLTRISTITYRHEIMRDLEEDQALFAGIKAFAEQMLVTRRFLELVGKLHFKHHKTGWFLEAASVYCDAVASLVDVFAVTSIRSRGLLAFHSFLEGYAVSDGFHSLRAETGRLREALSEVRYCVLIKDSTVRVRKYEGEIDYSVEVLNTFEKFKQGAVKDYRSKLNLTSGMNHVEGQILDFVARLHPDLFERLEQFVIERAHFLDKTIATFDREIQFYIAYIDYIAPLKRAGLKFCYPSIATADKEISASDAFDLALARKLNYEGTSVICNDFYLEGEERVIVVSGPNQGGKTTFARMFGQLHYLAILGCPVPGRAARLFLGDRIFTHFEREEQIQNLRGKLQDDLVRMHHILDEATPDSIIVINEIFTSTTASDAAFLGQEMMARILDLDALCVCVTFIDDLASLSEKTVSMVSTVVPDNPAERTFRIVRRPADGLAYAISIAEKHRLTYRQLKDRIAT
jgi:DNA mismatch repair protein MutS